MSCLLIQPLPTHFSMTWIAVVERLGSSSPRKRVDSLPMACRREDKSRRRQCKRGHSCSAEMLSLRRPFCSTMFDCRLKYNLLASLQGSYWNKHILYATTLIFSDYMSLCAKYQLLIKKLVCWYYYSFWSSTWTEAPSLSNVLYHGGHFYPTK